MLENDRTRRYSDQLIIMDNAIHANKPDTGLMDWAQSSILLVDHYNPTKRNSRESRNGQVDPMFRPFSREDRHMASYTEIIPILVSVN